MFRDVKLESCATSAQKKEYGLHPRTGGWIKGPLGILLILVYKAIARAELNVQRV